MLEFFLLLSAWELNLALERAYLEESSGEYARVVRMAKLTNDMKKRGIYVEREYEIDEGTSSY